MQTKNLQKSITLKELYNKSSKDTDTIEDKFFANKFHQSQIKVSRKRDPSKITGQNDIAVRP